jgi:RNA polymerase sigma factor (sigma-70 family)
MIEQKVGACQNEEVKLKADIKIDEQSDLLLWKSFKSGNESAFILIYETYFEKLYSYGRRLTSDEGIIKDAIQDLFIELRENRENLGDTDSIKFYLFKCLKRKIIRELESWIYNHEELKEGLPVEITFSREQVLIDSQLDIEKTDRLNQALQRLSKRKREAIYYLYYEGLSYEQIRDIMDLSHVRSARNLVYKALDFLRGAIG